MAEPKITFVGAGSAEFAEAVEKQVQDAAEEPREAIHARRAN